MSKIKPTGVERFFPPSELIVSKTDRHGRMTYTNRTFQKVSGFEEAELLGQPHSMIRHPDMPMAIFELLWDRIQAGHEIFAYVVNICKNGDHYWVFAHVTPTFDESGAISGFHSNRRVPAREAVSAMTELYATLRQEERRHGNKRDGLAASKAALKRHLETQGTDYDAFVWNLTNACRAA